MRPMEMASFRAPKETMAALDKWVAEMNATRRVKLSRSDVIRGLIEWTLENKPDWDKR